MKRIFWISAALLFALFFYRALPLNDTLMLGKKTFCIPTKYSTSSTIYYFKSDDADDYTGFFRTYIDPSEVKLSIADYDLFHNHLQTVFSIDVRTAPQKELKHTLSNQYIKDALLLKNKFEESQIQYITALDLYRISEWGDYPPPFITWQDLKTQPNKNAVLPEKLDDYFLADCFRLQIGDHSIMCYYALEIDGFLVKITTSENNLHLKKQMSAYAKTLLNTWEKNCD